MAMRFRVLQIHNFGPYYSTQSLTFGESLPVVLVHGPNMAGKTSLLNAVRWVLYGHALDRAGRSMSLVSLVNWDAIAERDWVMWVKLTFQVDETAYDLERGIQPK